MTPPEVHPGPGELAQAAARHLAEAARAAVAARGRAALALAGGRTPLSAYRLLGSRDLPWAAIHLFWGDERCPPPGETAPSNFRAGLRALGPPAGLPAVNLHPIPAALGAGEGARRYREELAVFFGGEDPPIFDLALLGLGPDGHVASLFPGGPGLAPDDPWVVAVPVPDLPPRVPRISLSLRVFNAAREVVVLTGGTAKAAAVARAITGGAGSPAGRLHPAGGVLWLLDRAAARLA